MELNLTQAGFFNPILQELLRRGNNIEYLLRQANLDKFDISTPEHYVPAHYVYNLLDAISYQQGSPDILDDFSRVIEVSCLARFGEIITYAPDLLSALILAEKYGSITNTHERAGFFIDGNTTTYWQKFVDDPRQKGWDQAVYIDLALAIKGFQIAAGNDRAPLEIHLQSQTCPNLDVLLPSGCHTRVFLGQPFTAVVFETSLLSAPMLPKDGMQDSIPELPQASSLTARIENILNSMLPGNAPNLDLFSEIMDISPRTLQRRLLMEDKTLSQVVEQWRMKTSIDLLHTTGMQVKEISERLSYSNASNFERAFRRWTQTTPNRYRKNLDS